MSIFPEKEKESPQTLIEKYLSYDQLDFKDIVGIACDYLLAGMDTTTYTTSFLFYHLAKNPLAQHTLYQETLKLLPEPDDPVTPKILEEATYAKCVLKESLRLRPISIGVGRILTQDVVFSGYNVPKGTTVVSMNQVTCRLGKYFPHGDEFIPERWLKGNPSYQQSHPYLMVPFGHGQRSCIARRFATQNMMLLLLKVIRQYKVEWDGKELDSRSLLINKPDGPINVVLKKR